MGDFNDPEWDTLFESFEKGCNKEDPLPFVASPKVVKRKFCELEGEDGCSDISTGTKCFRLSGNTTSLVDIEPAVAADNISLNLFATPVSTWSFAKKKRFDAMQRLQAKKRSGHFGAKQSKKYTVRKKLANRRKRTKKGQFARTTKFKWVSVCDLE